MPVKGIHDILEVYVEMFGDSFKDNFEVCGNENLGKLTYDESNINERKKYSLQGMQIKKNYMMSRALRNI